MLAKAQRYFCIYTRTAKKTPVMRWPELFTVIAIVTAMNAAILVLAFAIGGIPRPVIASQLESTNVAFITCIIQPTGWQVAVVVIGIILNIFILGLSSILLLSSREQRTRYNDQHYLTYFSCNFVIVGIFLTIIYFTQQTRVAGIVRRYIVRALAMLMIAYGALFFLIGPKALYIWRTWRTKKREQRNQGGYVEDRNGRHFNNTE